MATVAMSAPRYFKYFAFISYSRKDEAFAKRLQHFLTGFRLPTKLCEQYPEKPRTLRPIFRDKTNLGIGGLEQGIIRGLNLSRHLIVICSEHSALPNKEGKNWIDEEVRAFLQLDEDNKDCVIPVLLREKDDLSIRKCLPPVVQELGLLAADVADKGEEHVFNEVAAKMLDIGTDELWDWWERELRRIRRKRRMGCLTGLLLAALAGYAGWWLWEYVTPHYTYFADYAERYNLPEGIYPLKEEDTLKRITHYRFTTRFHHLCRVEALNAKGFPSSLSEAPERAGRPDVITLDYDSSSAQKPVRQTYFFSHRGEYAEQERDVSDNLIVLHPDRQTSRKGFHSSDIVREFDAEANDDMLKRRDKNVGVQRIQLSRDSRGFVMQEEYWADSFFRTTNEDGVWGCRFERDEKGRLLEVISLDDFGRIMNNRAGIARTVYEYDPHSGELQRVAYFNSNDCLVPGPDGYAEAHFQRMDGHLYSCSFFNGEIGYRDVFNENGELIERVLMDDKGNLLQSNAGFAGYRVYYDSLGHVVKRHYFDSSNRPCMVKKGYAGYRMVYDARGKEVGREFFDTEGHPCTQADGYASYHLVYDERGNETSRAFYDATGNLCLQNEGYAAYKITYDEREQETSRAFFDMEWKPCMVKDGYASYQCRYDKGGNEILRTFYDTTGCICTTKDGYATRKVAYDAQGHKTEEAYFDTEGNLCMHKDGYAGKEFTYDAEGNITSITLFDTERTPIQTIQP